MSLSKKWKVYLKEDAVKSSYDLGSTFAYLKQGALFCRKRVDAFLSPPDRTTFKDELNGLLRSRLSQTNDLDIQRSDYRRLLNELHKLFLCLLASNRTPEEIFHGLKDDFEMRNEVIEMLIKRSRVKASRQTQRSFLNWLLSGDERFGALLVKQKEKAGFPYTI